MVSAIGRPIDDPELLEVRVFGGIEADGHELASVLEPLVRDELARLPGYAGRLLRGQLVLDDWPLERRAGDGHDR